MKSPSIAVIGGGQMARALVGGMIQKGVVDVSKLTIVGPNPAMRAWWETQYPGCRTASSTRADAGESAFSQSDMILIAVKPHIVATVLDDAGAQFAGKLVVSIAAGIPIRQLTAGAGHDRVARVMPNTPSLVGEGASAYCTAAGATADDVASIEAMLSSVGYVTAVTENQLDAVTGLSGSGPAYVFLIIEALADGGVAAGLPRKIALELATQTVLGAATMVRESGDHPGQLKDRVCSPGGTTIAAMRVLEQNAVRGALIDAVIASATRSRELSR